MSKNKKNVKKATILIDDKEFKVITKLDKQGNQQWTKFQSMSKGGLDVGTHTYTTEQITKNKKQNHIDFYMSGKKYGVKPIDKIGLAGVALVRTEKGLEQVNLPSIIVPEEELLTSRPVEEILHEYIKRVKVKKVDN